VHVFPVQFAALRTGAAMQTSTTIVAVTVLIEYLLREELARSGGGSLGNIKLSTQPPPRNVDEQESQINLFLWQIVAQPQLNAAIRRSVGSAPDLLPRSLPLEFYYLVSITSNQELMTELLLGTTIACFEAYRFVEPATLERAIAAIEQQPRPLLQGLQLQQALEHVEGISIMPHYLNIEELSRVWAALQVPMRPAVSYKVLLRAGVSS
jgi:hypothetical protein